MTTTSLPARAIPRFGWGDRIRRIRKDNHMDQAQFADSIGLSKGAIGQHEMRDDVPQSGRLMAHAIEAVFGIDAHWLLTGCDCREAETCRLTAECSAIELRGIGSLQLYRRAMTDAGGTLAALRVA